MYSRDICREDYKKLSRNQKVTCDILCPKDDFRADQLIWKSARFHFKSQESSYMYKDFPELNIGVQVTKNNQ